MSRSTRHVASFDRDRAAAVGVVGSTKIAGHRRRTRIKTGYPGAFAGSRKTRNVAGTRGRG